MVGMTRTVPGLASLLNRTVNPIGSRLVYACFSVKSESTGILPSTISGMMTRLQSNKRSGIRSSNSLMLVRFMLTSFNLVTILHTESNRLFQYVQFDIADRFELDAIPGYAGLPDRLSVSLREMPFIRNTE